MTGAPHEIQDTNLYPVYISKAYNLNDHPLKAMKKIVTGLTDLYRYFEPAFFSGEFYMCKSFDDNLCFPRERAIDLYDKAVLLHKTSGKVIVQILDNESIFMWEDEDTAMLINNANILTYYFKNNREFFLANDKTIEITQVVKGSRYASQFVDLMKHLTTFNVDRIYQSTCGEFKKSWFDVKRLFFRTEGSGKNIPEEHMQESLFDYLNICLRGITMEVNREYNVSTETAKPKPVDIKIQWREANRTALIEIKWLGTSKNIDSKKVTKKNLSETGANPGYAQLKGYYDSAISDVPDTIVKAHLVVIDGRRNNLQDESTSISFQDGMHYKHKELVIVDESKYYETNPAFEKPIRMFAAPITG